MVLYIIDNKITNKQKDCLVPFRMSWKTAYGHGQSFILFIQFSFGDLRYLGLVHNQDNFHHFDVFEYFVDLCIQPRGGPFAAPYYFSTLYISIYLLSISGFPGQSKSICRKGSAVFYSWYWKFKPFFYLVAKVPWPFSCSSHDGPILAFSFQIHKIPFHLLINNIHFLAQVMIPLPLHFIRCKKEQGYSIKISEKRFARKDFLISFHQL